MTDSLFEEALARAADDTYRSGRPAVAALRAESVAYFRALGLSDGQIAEMMALPGPLLPRP